MGQGVANGEIEEQIQELFVDYINKARDLFPWLQKPWGIFTIYKRRESLDKNEITQELLKEHLDYRDGHLFWIKPTSIRVKIGEQFGHCNNKGYRVGKFRGKAHKEHRLIWLYHYGEWPKEYLDHINGVPDDNRIENLRECAQQQNVFNRKSGKGSTSIYKGVCWSKQHKKWHASYRHKGKLYHVGRYATEIEAAEAYREATEHLHGEFTNYSV